MDVWSGNVLHSWNDEIHFQQVEENVMSSLTRKFNRQNKGSKPISKSDYDYIYDMVRSQMHQEISDNIKKRLNDEVVPKLYEQARKEVAAQTTTEAYAHFLAVACNILMNDFGKLRNKDTRLKVFYEKLNEYSEEVENPSQKQLDAEAELARQVYGIKLQR